MILILENHLWVTRCISRLYGSLDKCFFCENDRNSCLIELFLNVVMVTKVHLKQKWLPQSPLPGSSKSSRIQTLTSSLMHSPRILKKPGLVHQPSIKSSSVSFSLSLKDCHSLVENESTCHGQIEEDIVLGSWIKPKNPRRALNYEIHGYHCWVSVTYFIRAVSLKTECFFCCFFLLWRIKKNVEIFSCGMFFMV